MLTGVAWIIVAAGAAVFLVSAGVALVIHNVKKRSH